jgi:hypothetical protein
VNGGHRAADGESIASLFPYSFLGCFCQDFPATAFFDLSALIDLTSVKRLFVLQFVIALETSGRQCSGCDRVQNGASWFFSVAAITKPATVCERLDVAKRIAHVPAVP